MMFYYSRFRNLLCAIIILYLYVDIYGTQDCPNTRLPGRHTYQSPMRSTQSSYFPKNKQYEKETEEHFRTCEERLQEKENLEKKLAKKGRVFGLDNRKTDTSLIRNFDTDPIVRSKEVPQLPFEEASDHLYRKYNVSEEEMESIDLTGEHATQAQQACQSAIDSANCDAYSKYRRMDGICNNLQNQRWGSARTCQPRLLPANYVGSSGFRVSKDGGPLPNPRQISLNVHYHYDRPTHDVTHMYMFFGQILDHDITMTPQSTTVDNQAINCCPPETETHPQCAPILLSENDPFYSQFDITCINFVRSATCPTCRLGKRQQMNQVTSPIDVSFMYGNSENESRALRTNDGTGKLRFQRSNYGDLLPASPDPQNDMCSFVESNDICFDTGDPRVNQHTVLTSLHTVFLREHNRIATVLGQINPHWNDEKIFQETRRILGAQMQVITYKEYLPITLGQEGMSYFSLNIGEETLYDPDNDPTILIEFSTAAFRFGHSLIHYIMTNRPPRDNNQPRLLRDEFFQPFELYRGLLGPLLEGVSNSPAQWFDRHLVPDVTEFLFRMRGDPAGLDLAALNLNRGRDNGLPTYVDTLRYCTGVNILTFNDLITTDVMLPERANVLRNNYKFVEDIDLWTGILCEKSLNDAVVGPTAACVIGIQFNRLKFGDRFYFEHINQAGSFTHQQVEELRKTTLSRIICLNTEIESMPWNAMLFANDNNPNTKCRSMTGIDLSYWKE